MKFTIQSIDHVQITAPRNSEEKARKFYGEILGFKEIEKPLLLQKNGGVWFTNGTFEVHIGVEDDFIAAKKAHPGFRVDNLENLKQKLTLNKIPYIIDDKIPNVQRIFINDPFGNRIEMLSK